MRRLELYLHIPFCVRKCAYCDFLSAPAVQAQQEAYLRALERELLSFPGKEAYRVSSVFFGGGTPSILPGEWIAELMGLLHRKFRIETDAEVTIECNPGTADAGKLRIWRDAGINRLSLGLQSADDGELALLGRIHTYEDFLRTYEAAREAGFANINVDLMSALPGQRVRSWEQTLAQVLALRPEHISAYSLIIEEGTPFYERYHEDAVLRERGELPRELPSEEDEREMYRVTERLLGAAGMQRYEISNYALPGFECRHNLGYWTGEEYAGFGIGAASLLKTNPKGAEASAELRNYRGKAEALVQIQNNCFETEAKFEESACGYVRLRNPESMQAYLAGDFSGREAMPLSEEDRMEEFMFLGLRMTRGVSEREFLERFGRSAEEVYGEVLRKHCADGLLKREDGRIALTARGLDLSNAVMADFLLE